MASEMIAGLLEEAAKTVTSPWERTRVMRLHQEVLLLVEQEGILWRRLLDLLEEEVTEIRDAADAREVRS